MEEGQAKKFDSPFLRALLYELRFLQNDAAGTFSRLSGLRAGREQRCIARPGGRNRRLFRKARQARDLSRQAVVAAKRAEEPEEQRDTKLMPHFGKLCLEIQ